MWIILTGRSSVLDHLGMCKICCMDRSRAFIAGVCSRIECDPNGRTIMLLLEQTINPYTCDSESRRMCFFKSESEWPIPNQGLRVWSSQRSQITEKNPWREAGLWQTTSVLQGSLLGFLFIMSLSTSYFFWCVSSITCTCNSSLEACLLAVRTTLSPPTEN